SSDVCSSDLAMRRPTVVLPVKETARTASCCTIASPASTPPPCTTLSTPGGTPASCASPASLAAVAGGTSDGLATTVLPAARAGVIFQVQRYRGRFHGEIVPTTPSGWRRV